MTTLPTSRQPLFTLTEGFRLVLASGSPRRRLFLSEWGLPFELARPDGAEPLPLPGEQPDAYTRRAAAAKAHAVAASLDRTGARASASTQDKAIILSADTVVAVDGDILGKPHDAAHALAMLQRLTGRGHEVISAVCLLLPPSAGAPEEIFGNAPCNAPCNASGKTSGDTSGDTSGKTPCNAPCNTSGNTSGDTSGDTPDHAPHKARDTDINCESQGCGAEELIFSDVSRVYFHPWPESVLRAYVDTGEPHDKAGAYAIQGQGAFLVDRIEGSWSTVVGLPVTQLAHLLLHRGFMRPCASPRLP
ncbi:MAG: Maf family protein [Desulfovibrio sp.]|uniref:Maf family protein n=1 Tax=Desulfovibrio sp. TaxID=885 RepID=UPI002A35BC21|nr:Maf family protein [Desulfovibrio sp.]MDY0260296.1 Maf family protein [Desulfovibrio sp.]